MPTVSVIMVFHRDTAHFRPAVASVLSQTFRDLELILVDNGTALPAAALGDLGRDSRIRWVRLPRNEGIPAGHNAGVAAASGEFIALADYDDVSLPHRVEAQVAALRGDASLGLVSALAERVDATGRVIGREFCLPDPADHRAYAPYATPIITQVAMGRREVLAAFPYRAEFPFAGDLDFQARVIERWRMAVLPEVLLRYRWYADQTTQQRGASIEGSRAAIQIFSGRRAAGRSENLTPTLATIQADTPAEIWRRGAQLCLAEDFFAFAAFQARRSFAWDRSLAGAWRAARLGWRAWRGAAPAERALVARMFFTGPVRALRLHPAERNIRAPAVA